jgi:hypothetical protein
MLNQDYKDILLCLNRQEVEYLLIGAYAMAAHGYPRATGDIDIWINSDTENAVKVFRALAEFGAPMSNISTADISYKGNVIQIGVAPCRVDIITSIDGVEFNQAWKNKKSILVDDINVFIISLEDLILNKTNTNREKDKIDVAELVKLRGC